MERFFDRLIDVLKRDKRFVAEDGTFNSPGRLTIDNSCPTAKPALQIKSGLSTNTII